MKKRAISFILAVAMIFTSANVSVWAEESESNVEITNETAEVEESSQEADLVKENIGATSEKIVESVSSETRSITYKLSGSTLTISGTGEISSCETDWSDNKDKITRIVINRGITSIGDGIFQGFSSLQSLQLPGRLEAIGDRAFYGCSSLKSISIPSSVVEIGSQAFYGCSSLKRISIPASVVEIGSETFADCSNVKNITMRGNTIKMGENVFKGCAAVTAGPTGSGSDYTFAWKSVIPENAFLGCENIQSVEIPNTIEAIEANAFVGCSSLSKVYVPNTVTSIANNAIDTSIEIITCEGSAAEEYAKANGNSLTILEETFSGACGDTITWELLVNDQTANTYTLNILGTGEMYDYSLIVVSPWELTKDKITKIVLSEGITAIGNKAFYKFSALTSLELPEGIETIGDKAFYNCSSLAKVTIPSTVVSIGNSAFSGCACKTAGPIGGGYDFEFSWTEEIPANAFYEIGELEEVTIPDGIKKIGNFAFSYCYSLKKVSIPASVTTMGDDEAVFSECACRTAGPIGGGYDFEFGWTDKIPANAFRGMDSLTQLILPEGVEEIGDYAFSGSALSSIKIPGSVTYIGESPFTNCDNLDFDNIETAGPIGGGYDYEFGWTEEIPENAFSGLAYIQSVEIPETIESIGANAFVGCWNLYELYVPKTVTSIGENAIDSLAKIITYAGSAAEEYANANGNDLTVLEEVFSGTCGDEANWELLVNDETTNTYTLKICGSGEMFDYSVSNIAPWEFVKEKITKIIISEGITGIGHNAFYNFTNLTSVELAEGIERIGGSAFKGCSSLRKITIPSTVSSIGDYNGDYAFAGCACKTAGPVDGGYDFEFSWEKSIPNYAFAGCVNLEEVMIPEGIKNIGADAFAYCSSLKKISVPASVTFIGDYADEMSMSAFRGCAAETAGPIGGDYDYQFGWTEEIPENAFTGLEYLEKIYFPKSISHSERNYFDVPVTVCGSTGSSAEAYANAHSNTVTFEAVDEYNVQFETYAPEKVETQSRFVGIRVIEPKNIEKEGYTLKGWYTSAEIMDETTKWDFANDVVTQDMTLYAKWISDTDKISEELKGYSLTLEGTIGVNFYMQLGEDVLADSEKGAYMNFTLERKDGNEYITVPVNKAAYDTEKACYVFKCGVPVKDMDIQIKGQIILSDGREGDVYSCTVREYIEVLKTDEKYKDQQKLLTLVENMSNFGDYAIAYFANGAIEETTEMKAVTSTALENYQATLPTDNSNIYYGSSLILKSDTILRHYFTKEVKVAEAGYKVGEKNGLYYIQSEGIPAHELGNSKTIHVTTIEDNKEIEITYSPLSYAYIALSRDGVNENLRSLIRAMYLYYQAALDYKGTTTK